VSSFLIEALSRLSDLRGKFLQEPQIAIGIAKFGILDRFLLLSLSISQKQRLQKENRKKRGREVISKELAAGVSGHRYTVMETGNRALV